ncbi:YbhB/YbcL family Raf kinase inhibitor-like protein [Desulfurococcaceae archaeon MEX13E-LK6-19]|nr:YbhB/YbcL family Raf kinase inhibitor-like protein [Desulfurococcaceae archaeon MEX13E-LK6-19]
MVIKVSSPAFGFGGKIPVKYTCDGEDISPPLLIKGVPPSAKSLVLIMYDPDAPGGTFYHWIMYNIEPKNMSLPENIPPEPETPYGLQGINDFNKIGYSGPCPPPGLGTHRYYILVLALDTKLDLEPGASKEEVINALKNHVIAYGYYMGVYGR